MERGAVKTLDQIRAEKGEVWNAVIENTGCKKEISDMEQCSAKGDWRICKEQVNALKECMDQQRKAKGNNQ